MARTGISTLFWARGGADQVVHDMNRVRSSVMKRTRNILCGLAIATTLVFVFPSAEASDNPRDYPPALVVANGALNARYHMEIMFAQVTYGVLDSYPASKTIQEVTSRVERQPGLGEDRVSGLEIQHQ